MGQPAFSGRWMSTSDGIAYEWKDGRWSLRFDEIAIVGEYTNELGPFADDYYFCFVRHDGVHWNDGSFYAEGRDELLSALARHFGTSFECELCDSTTFNSRIMWPPALCDRPLFEYKDPVPRNRLSAWLRTIGLKPITNVQTVAAEIREFLISTVHIQTP